MPTLYTHFSKIRILILTGQHPKECIGGAELQAYYIAKNIHKLGTRTVFCTWTSDVAGTTIENDGLINFAISKRHSLLGRIRQFARFLRQYKPDVVYVRCLYSCWWVLLLSLYYNYKVIYHSSNVTECVFLTPKEWKKGIRSCYRAILLDMRMYATRFADTFICQTEDQQELVRRNLRREAIVVYSGHPVHEQIPEKDDFPRRIVWIGKQHKNPHFFLDLARNFRDNPDFHFSIMGRFRDNTCRPFMDAEKEVRNFAFLGALPHEEVNRQLESAHALVCTSDYEGFSNTFIQAWLRGVPVVSMKVNPDNLLTRHRIGLVSETVEMMTVDIQNLFANGGAMFQEYSNNAIKYAQKYHNIEDTVRKILRVSREVLHNSSKIRV